ncbi:MAG: thermonuclease family protein [Sedimenticola sp.]|nr:thermonuclease family protein [Sedimenticola sp.]
MRTLSLALLLLLSTPILLAGEAENSYTLVAVEDGDTLIVKIGTEEKRLQLSGIDAPEDVVNPKFTKDLDRTKLSSEVLLNLGKLSTDHLKQLLTPGDQLRIMGDLDNSDRYGRVPVLAYTASNLSLNEQMVSDGYAVVLSRTPLQEPLKQQFILHQQQAQKQQSGLWGEQRNAAALWSGQTVSD